MPAAGDADGATAATLAGWGAEATPEAVAERLRRVGVDVDGGGAVLKRGWFDASFVEGPQPEAVAFLNIDCVHDQCHLRIHGLGFQS
jgi:hypothetical protein